MPNQSKHPGLLGYWRGRKSLAIALSVALLGLMGATASSAVTFNAFLKSSETNTYAKDVKTQLTDCGNPAGTDGWHFVVPSSQGKDLKVTGFEATFSTGVVTSFTYGANESQVFVNSPAGAMLVNAKAVVTGRDLKDPIEFTLSHICLGVMLPPPPEGFLNIEKRDMDTEALITTGTATFEITWGSSGSKTVTDNGVGDAESDTGKISVKLPLGETYTVTETVAPAGYMKDSNSKSIYLTETGLKLTFWNQVIIPGKEFGDLTVSKFDFDSRDSLLEGATFALWNESATVKLMEKTDGADGDVADGKVTFKDVPYGQYKVQEVTPPMYFDKDTTDIRDITVDSATETLAFYNKRAKGDLIIEKRDSDTKNLITEGDYQATFLIAWNSETMTVTDDMSGDAEQDNGVIAVRNLPQGYEYTVTEVTAPGGYIKATSPQKVVLDDQEKLVYFNDKIIPGQDRGSVIVKKYIDDTETLLGGATFQLVREDNPDSKFTIKDNDEADADSTAGIIKFNDVEFGWTWVLSEVSAPEFFVKDTKTVDVKLSGENPSDTFNFYNKRAQADLTIIKRVGSTTGSLLGGATFTISRDTPTMTPIAVADNGSLDLDKDSGEFLVSGLDAGYTYTVTESAVPAGYVGASAQTILLPSAGGTLTFVNTLPTTGGGGTPPTAGGQTLNTLLVKKYVKGTTTLLPGATFKVTGPGLPTDGVTVIDGQGGDVLDGLFTFPNLIVGNVYVVAEVTAPQYFKTVTASKNHTMVVGDNTLTFENERISGSITVIKEATGTDTKLAGASFKFWREGDETNAITVADNSAADVDKRDGYITVAGLEYGYKYLVQETVAPTGYKLVSTVFAVPNLSSEMVTFTVDNDLATEGGVVLPGGEVVLPGTGAGLSQQIGMSALALLILGSLLLAFARTRRTN